MKYFVLKPKGNDVYALASREAMRTYATVLEEAQIDLSLANSLKEWIKKEFFSTLEVKIKMLHKNRQEESDMTIKEVYEEYKHFARLLSDKEWLTKGEENEKTFIYHLLYDFWQAIKTEVASQIMLIHKKESK